MSAQVSARFFPMSRDTWTHRPHRHAHTHTCARRCNARKAASTSVLSVHVVFRTWGWVESLAAEAARPGGAVDFRLGEFRLGGIQREGN